MKFKFLLSVMSLFAVANIALPAAQAQEASAPSQRWHFAPNVYRVEQPTMPKNYASYSPATRTVTTGSVPKGSSFLGINPAILKPRPVAPAPMPQPVVTAQLRPATFNNSFGKPIAAAPTELPLTAAPAGALPQPKAAAPARIAHAPVHHASWDGRATLRKPHVPSSQMASSQPIATYGQGHGYEVGVNTPSASGGSYGASTQVSGVLRTKVGRH
jgi:hypothetical protein